MNLLTSFFYESRIMLGFYLTHLGTRLLGFSVVLVYSPDNDEYLRAMHFAENETQLNSSMRVYVEELDARYQ